MNKLNKIEEKLLKRELEAISKQLGEIGKQLQAVFSKYGTIEGHLKGELIKYIVEEVIKEKTVYRAGYTTSAGINSDTTNMPDSLKAAILEWVVTDFLEKTDYVVDVVEGLE